MLSGLVLMEVDPTNGDILQVFDDGVDSDELNDLLDWDKDSEIVKKIKDEDRSNISLYYFGDEETDGAMKTGATTVTIDGESYNFLFSKTGGAEGKGKGMTGVDDNKYIYNFGCRIKASSDDKYQVVAVAPNVGTAVDIHAPGVVVATIKSSDLKEEANAEDNPGFINDKDETVRGVDLSLPQNSLTKLYLVNTSGNIQKSKVAVKDGDEWYFYVKNRAVKLYTNNKNLDAKATSDTEKWEDYVTYLESAN